VSACDHRQDSDAVAYVNMPEPSRIRFTRELPALRTWEKYVISKKTAMRRNEAATLGRHHFFDIGAMAEWCGFPSGPHTDSPSQVWGCGVCAVRES